MAPDRDEIQSQLREIRLATTKIQALVSDLMKAVAALPIPDTKPRPTCPVCTIQLPRVEGSLREHLTNVHGTDPATIQALEDAGAV